MSAGPQDARREAAYLRSLQELVVEHASDIAQDVRRRYDPADTGYVAAAGLAKVVAQHLGLSAADVGRLLAACPADLFRPSMSPVRPGSQLGRAIKVKYNDVLSAPTVGNDQGGSRGGRGSSREHRHTPLTTVQLDTSATVLQATHIAQPPQQPQQQRHYSHPPPPDVPSFGTAAPLTAEASGTGVQSAIWFADSGLAQSAVSNSESQTAVNQPSPSHTPAVPVQLSQRGSVVAVVEAAAEAARAAAKVALSFDQQQYASLVNRPAALPAGMPTGPKPMRLGRRSDITNVTPLSPTPYMPVTAQKSVGPGGQLTPKYARKSARKSEKRVRNRKRTRSPASRHTDEKQPGTSSSDNETGSSEEEEDSYRRNFSVYTAAVDDDSNPFNTARILATAALSEPSIETRRRIENIAAPAYARARHESERRDAAAARAAIEAKVALLTSEARVEALTATARVAEGEYPCCRAACALFATGRRHLS